MQGSAHIRNEGDRNRVISWLARAALPEHGLALSWKPWEETRRNRQNRLLWAGAYRPIAEFLTEKSGKVITSEQVHLVAKDRFMPREVVEFNGKSKSYPRSTTKLTVREFNEYLEQVFAWGAEMGVWFEEGPR